MLKTAVVYLPGSGGNFLYRTINLGPHTMDPNELDPAANVIRTTPEQRLKMFNNWGSLNREDWKDRECEFLPGHKLDKDFYLYEQSDLWYVDCAHSNEFLNNIEVLNLDGKHFFETLVLIDPRGREKFLLDNQRRKKYSCKLELELLAHEELSRRYPDRIVSIPFDSFFAWETFEPYIVKIDQRLGLDLPMAAVKENWEGWITHSKNVWLPT